MLFGNEETDNSAIDETETEENSKELSMLQEETIATKKLLASHSLENYGKRVFSKIFHADIQRLCEMVELWKDKSPPKVISMDQDVSYDILPTGLERDQKIWNLATNYKIFTEAYHI